MPTNLPDPSPPEEDKQEWMATFSDMVTLLLVFFVLLLSMSTTEIRKSDAVLGSMRQTFGGKDNHIPVTTGSLNSQDESQTSVSVMELQKIRQEILKSQKNTFDAIKSYITKKSVDGQVSAVLDEGTITLTLGDGILFQKGEIELAPEADKYLQPLLDIIMSNREMTVSIKGYTDNDEVPEGARFKDKWELSALRSVNVLRWFVDHKINPLRLSATGMGDLNPIFPNDTPANQAKNRRVEFNLERTINEPKK